MKNRDQSRGAAPELERPDQDQRRERNWLFHEYFHGETGRGVGASHQTGWAALAIGLIEDIARTRAAGEQAPRARRTRAIEKELSP